MTVLAVPLPALNWQAHALVAIYAWAVVYWITEALPVAVTAVLSSLLAVMLGVASARSVFGASFGFMLPISTPPNAIVYGSGLVPLGEMVRSGIWLDVGGAIIIWGGLRVLCPLFGVT